MENEKQWKQLVIWFGNKITGFLKNSQQNNSKTVTNEFDKEIPKERHASLKERQKKYW